MVDQSLISYVMYGLMVSPKKGVVGEDFKSFGDNLFNLQKSKNISENYKHFKS